VGFVKDVGGVLLVGKVLLFVCLIKCAFLGILGCLILQLRWARWDLDFIDRD